MANYNLTNQAIEDSFEPLLQIDSGSALRDGTGSLVDNIIVTSSYALTASFAENAIPTDTGSLLTTASFDDETRNLTFTKGDSSTFSVNIPDVSGSVLPSGVVSGSSQIILTETTGNLGGNRITGSVQSAVSASYALSASYAVSASYEIIKEISSSYADHTQWSGIYNVPSGLVSGSSQIDLGQTIGTASQAVSSSYAIIADSANKVKINSNSSDLSYPLIFGTTNSVSDLLKDSQVLGLTYNPSSNTLRTANIQATTGFTGNLSGTSSFADHTNWSGIYGIPSGLVSSSEQLILSASQVTFITSSTSLSSSNVQDAIKELDLTKASIDALSSNIIIYPTTATSSIAGYFTLVTSPDEVGYNTTAVDIPTGIISGSNQFIAALATTGSLFTGNPGIINITTLGNVRRTGGGSSATAEFYFEVYKRSGSVETLIATSNTTREVNADSYEQFNATALLNNGIYTADDIIVTKYYGNNLSGNPTFDFQFGGEQPIRTLIPVPASVITDPSLALRVDSLEQFSGSINQYTSSNDSKVQSLIDATGSYATTGSNTFVGNQDVNGIVSSTQNKSNIHYNPQIITDNVIVPTGQNGIIIGETTISGDLTVEGNSEVFFYTQPPLTEYLTTQSYQIDSASFDTRINVINNTTGSFATTGSNSFIGNQTVSGSLIASGSYTAFGGATHTLTGRTRIFAPNNDETQLPGFIVESNTQLLGGQFLLTQDSAKTNTFSLASDGQFRVEWPSRNTFFNMQNGAFQFSTNRGVGMFFDSPGIKFLVTEDINERHMLAMSARPSLFPSLNVTPYTGSCAGIIYNQSNNFNSPTKLLVGAKVSSSFDDTLYTDMNFFASGSANISTLKLREQDPLPTGSVGDLATSGSNLYFHNGTSWSQIN